MAFDHTLRIHFDLGDNSLYDLSYLSADIYQLIVYCSLLEKNDQDALNKYFYNQERRVVLNRNSLILNEYRSAASIDHLEDGSVEIFIAGASFIAAVVMPVIAMRIEKKRAQASQTITFEISADDPELSALIGQLAYGSETDEPYLDRLSAELAQRGYSIEAVSNDTFRVNEVFEKYEQRIIKTIAKHDK